MVIEDERDLSRLLELDLRGAGFRVASAESGGEGLALVEQQQPDVVVLELMLPDTSGDEICRQIRREPRTASIGVLMLAAEADAEERILGRELGADDYVIKPVVGREVVLRVTALANQLAERAVQTPSETPARLLKVGPIELDPALHEVRIGGAPTRLRPLEYTLLQLLVSEPGRVFTREELLARVWNLRGDLDVRTVDVHVRRLRASLGPAGDLIETVGPGYRATCDV